MEVAGITEAFKCLKDANYEPATTITDSISTLKKARSTILYAEIKDLICRSNLFRIVWIFSPGQAAELTGEAVVGG